MLANPPGIVPAFLQQFFGISAVDRSKR